ncbi:MAG: sigma-54-dependent Fis family transcriptional regulator [Chlamydiae bacterium]|nr:sigma-54-dependent Fis family transcriptional regulator [Chlamydiota bacterium]MBI3276866.1 sigma-54-dependent Fis family transcriptional regulator [Chlamydiota bacterium]
MEAVSQGARDAVFIVDDEQDLCLSVKRILGAEGHKVEWATHPETLLEQLPNNRFSCVLLDLKLGGESGIDYLSKIRESDPNLPIIIMTAYETVKTAVEAMKKGAFHYLAKPFDNEELKALVSNAVKMRRLYWDLEHYKAQCANRLDLESEMGDSQAIRTVIRQIHAVSQTDVNVLLIGESGTGKELVSKRIHDLSPRAQGPWIPIDCASLPETLIESELFGHEKGAFTGAHAQRIGKLEQAHGGTLFLDEIANIPLSIQAKLLRFMERRSFERLGGNQTVTVSLRVIAAANQDVQELIRQKQFRGDLYYRLNEFPIHLPPLRERCNDIPYLSLQFLHEFEKQLGKKVTGISEEVLEVFQKHPWPGNVRELRNTIKRAMVVANGEISKADLPNEIKSPISEQAQSNLTIPLKSDLDLLQSSSEAALFVEKKLIQQALSRTQGRKGKAAKLLGIDEKTLYNKLRELKMGEDIS